jgi:hypothetical protein
MLPFMIKIRVQPPENERAGLPPSFEVRVPEVPRCGDTFRTEDKTLYDVSGIEFKQIGESCDVVVYLSDIVPES